MYVFSFILYALTLISYFSFPAIKNMVNQAALLAPQITYACGFLLVFPFVMFLCHFVFKLKSRKYYSLLATQTKLAASVAVSLGLIGTFIGLTDMVSAIAGSLGGDGDISAKMGVMIGSISSALSAMAFAFLTSILGVAVSVLLLISLNFLAFFYDSEKKDDVKEKNATKDNLQLQLLLTRLDSLEDINTSIASKLVCVPENTNLSAQLVENSNVMVAHLLELNLAMLDIGKRTQELIDITSQSFNEMATSLISIHENGTVVSNKIELNLGQLDILNSSIRSLNEITQRSYEFNEKTEIMKVEQLSALSNNQKSYFQQQNELKIKMRKMLEVFVNEN
ncbi:hypothetical protein [Citrobacter cronae]|uniref:hypothetical protein n=1 Tax=Citrobacter cronae TaxID=1748967 RepID=UPI001C10F696|nr:hypothetical protein [Citrobacter cronae]MBU5388912.1 hypothetical protein [Citrobacter cronae]